MSLKKAALPIVLSMIFFSASSFADEKHFCRISEQTNEILDADFPYDFVKEVEIKLNDEGSIQSELGTNSLISFYELGTFHSVRFLVSYDNFIPRLITVVNGTTTQHQAYSSNITTVVTTSAWTVAVSCAKR